MSRFPSLLMTAGTIGVSCSSNVMHFVIAARWRVIVRQMSVKRNKAASYNMWLVIIPVTTFGLGTWQVFRLQWKVNLIKKLEERTKEDTIALPAE